MSVADNERPVGARHCEVSKNRVEPTLSFSYCQTVCRTRYGERRVLLEDRVAIVTGASSGIGRESAKLFAHEGAKVVVCARRKARLDTLVEEIHREGGEALAVAGDVSSDDWQAVLDTNLTSAFLAAKYQIPAMTEPGGSLIFTSSFVGHTIGFPQQAAYAASKTGLIGLTRVLASEHGPQGIRVNALLPGGTDTAMASDFGEDPAVEDFVRSIHALKRIASPAEIARSALYLASDMSSFTTGSAMLVDGGVSITRT